jgi:high-affinity nickel-transport protein
MDPDHLAAIDGLTRSNAESNPRLSRWAGLLFSLGHGSVVVVAAILLGTIFKHAQAPSWTAISGTLFSAFFLFLIGGLNLGLAWRPRPHHALAPIGLRTAFFRNLFQVRRPWLIFGVGGLFAISFDTLSQAAFFSLAGSRTASWGFSAFLGVAFMVGMMTPDALNGLWISRLVRRADRCAPAVSRMMTGTLGLMALLIGTWELVTAVAPALTQALEHWQLFIGCSIAASTGVGFWVASRMASRREPIQNTRC